jgi:hypothetical protein
MNTNDPGFEPGSFVYLSYYSLNHHKSVTNLASKYVLEDSKKGRKWWKE